jgi:hypothetical protein
MAKWYRDFQFKNEDEEVLAGQSKSSGRYGLQRAQPSGDRPYESTSTRLGE